MAILIDEIGFSEVFFTRELSVSFLLTVFIVIYITLVDVLHVMTEKNRDSIKRDIQKDISLEMMSFTRVV